MDVNAVCFALEEEGKQLRAQNDIYCSDDRRHCCYKDAKATKHDLPPPKSPPLQTLIQPPISLSLGL